MEEEESKALKAMCFGITEDNMTFLKFLRMEDTPYFSAIGHFINDYASAESALHILARYLSQLQESEARAIFGGMRLEDLIDRIRSLIRLRSIKDEDAKMIEECITQLRKIGGARHRLVHRTIEVKETEIHVSNFHTAKSMSIDNEIFLIEDLDNMANDCRRIFSKVIFFVYPHAYHSQPEEIENTWLNGPWRYRPVLPMNASQSKIRKKKERRRPPPSSREL